MQINIKWRCHLYVVYKEVNMKRRILWQDKPKIEFTENSSDIYKNAMEITDQQEAQEYFESLVSFCMKKGKSREESIKIQKSNLGYFAGYYDNETRLKVENLFECSHPVFGNASKGEPTLEEAFKMGRELGEKMKAGKL